MSVMVESLEEGSVGCSPHLGPTRPCVVLIVTLHGSCLRVCLTPAKAALLGANLVADAKSAEPWSEEWEAEQQPTGPESEEL